MILKNILTSLYLFVLVASPVFSQEFHPGFSRETSQYPGASHETFRQDTSFWGNVIIKINPMLIATGTTAVGEYGGIIQFPIEILKNMDAYVGGGYNQNFDSYTAATQPNGKGYTMRAGVYYQMKKKKYVSFQFFYRRWNIKSIYETEDGPIDNITNPLTFLGDTYDVEHSIVTDFDNAKVNIYAVDIIYGKQYRPRGNRGGLFFEWFIGGGLRYKAIDFEELGNYNSLTYLSYGITPGTYQPFNTPMHVAETSIYPDVKLGFMIGFVL